MSVFGACPNSFMELWNVSAALTIFLLTLSSFHLPRLIYLTSLITMSMICSVHLSLMHKSISNTRKIVVTMIRNNVRLSTMPPICFWRSKTIIPVSRLAIVIPVPMSLWATREATTFPLVPFCSLVIKYILEISPLMDSAGITMSIKIPYQT